jgi:hypothetical protein
LTANKEIQRKLADPRITSPEEAKRLIAEGKTVLVVTCNVHSTEIASSQSATEFAYQLATGDTPKIRSILQNVIIDLVPSLNPDGQQLVVDPGGNSSCSGEGQSLASADSLRHSSDGVERARIYLPPWVDPIDPNVDPILVESMNALGTETALEIGQTGKQGVLIHGVYDSGLPCAITSRCIMGCAC